MQFPHFYLLFEKKTEISDFSFESNPVPVTIKSYLSYDIYKNRFDNVNTEIKILKDDAKKNSFKIPFDFYACATEYNGSQNKDISLQKNSHYKLTENEKARELIDKMNSLLVENVVSFTDEDFKTGLSKLNDFCPLKFINCTGNVYSKDNGKLQVKTKFFPDKNDFVYSIEERTDITFDNFEISVWVKDNPDEFKVWNYISYNGIHYSDKKDYEMHKRTEAQIRKKYVPDIQELEKVFSMIEEIKNIASENKGSDFFKKIEQLSENPIADKIVKNHERFSKHIEKTKDIEIKEINSFYENVKDSFEKTENLEKDNDSIPNNDYDYYDYYDDIE